jgi:hypothetical protein
MIANETPIVDEKIKKAYEKIMLNEEAAETVPFKIKPPAKLEDINIKYLYMGTQNAALNLFNKMADERGLSAPITVQILKDWQECEPKLKQLLNNDLKGIEAIKIWWNVCKEYYTIDMPFARKLVRKYKEIYEILRWS